MNSFYKVEPRGTHMFLQIKREIKITQLTLDNSILFSKDLNKRGDAKVYLKSS